MLPSPLAPAAPIKMQRPRTVKELASLARDRGWGHPSWSDEDLARYTLHAEAEERDELTEDDLTETATAKRGSNDDALLEAIAGAVGEVFDQMQRKHRATLKKLEARVSELEQRPELKFAGVWRKDTSYKQGAVVSDRGKRLGL